MWKLESLSVRKFRNWKIWKFERSEALELKSLNVWALGSFGSGEVWKFERSEASGLESRKVWALRRFTTGKFKSLSVRKFWNYRKSENWRVRMFWNCRKSGRLSARNFRSWEMWKLRNIIIPLKFKVLLYLLSLYTGSLLLSQSRIELKILKINALHCKFIKSKFDFNIFSIYDSRYT